MHHNANMSFRWLPLPWVVPIAIVFVFSLSLMPALCQRDVAEVAHPAGLMKLQVEDPVTLSRIEVDSNGNVTTYYWQRPGGRFRLLTGSRAPVGGDPTKPGDEARAIASEVRAGLTGPDDAFVYDAFTSKLTVSIDGTAYDIHVRGEAADESTSTPANFWPVAPQAGSRDLYAIGRIPLDDDNPNNATEWVDVEQRFTLIHDAVQLEYVVSNESASSIDVGIRQLIDATFGQWQRDGGIVVLPTGRQILTEKQIPDSEIPTVPNTWVAYDDIDDPTVMVRGTLEGSEVHDPGYANESAGKPDQIAWGMMRSIGIDEQWDFAPNPAVGLQDEDWAYAVRWDEEPLAPGRTRRYVTYYGLGAATVDYDPPYALAAYSPNALKVKEGDDPTTGQIERFYLTDQDGKSPFAVQVYADNFSPSPILDASVRIALPEGFELSPLTQSLSKRLGTLARNELKDVSWTVRASVARPGSRIIEFTGPNGKVVQREIIVPIIPALTAMPSATGLEMVSIPYEFGDSSVDHVFEDLGPMYLGGGNGLARWNPDQRLYRWFPHSFVTDIVPGEAYWLLNERRQTVYFPDDLSTVPTGWEYSLDVKEGWNQIGTPFTQATYLQGMTVIDENNSEWSTAEAIARNLILGTVFAYDAENNEYVWETELDDVVFTPYTGYWMYCTEDLILKFVPESLYAGAASTAGDAAPVSNSADPGWNCELVVSGAGRVRSQRSFGIAPGADNGLDSSDVLAPPAAIQNGTTLTARLTNPHDGAQYIADVRPAGERENQWTLAVTTNAVDEPITIRWPDLSTMPNDLVATLVDTATGQSRYMRTTRSYTYRTGDEPGTREFNIIVRPRDKQPLLVKAASAMQTSNGVSVVYTLSKQADVDLEIRNISGVLIRKPADNRPADAGVNTLIWDGRSERGMRVPAGRYLLRVVARCHDTGQQHSRVCSFQLHRK